MQFTAKVVRSVLQGTGADIYAFTQSADQDYRRKAAALGLPWFR